MASPPESNLAGLRVLVVEDEMAIALMIEDVLTGENCTIIGSFHRVAAALEVARRDVIDLAVLDVNIAGEKIFPVAEALEARKIPFVLLSGYGQNALPPEHPDWVVCSKPFRLENLVKILREQIQPRYS